jgi:outer membrane protein W
MGHRHKTEEAEMAIHKILGATAICAIVLGVVPTQAQTQEQSDETGAYVGVNWARSDLDGYQETGSTYNIGIPDTKGDGFGFTFGYRINENWRAEAEFQQIDYDSTPVSVNRIAVGEICSFESDWRAFSLVWQTKMGARNQFRPFIKLAHVEMDTSFTFRAPGYEEESYSGDESGRAESLGFDYMMTEEMFLRGQITFFDGEDVIAIGPIWHF